MPTLPVVPTLPTISSSLGLPTDANMDLQGISQDITGNASSQASTSNPLGISLGSISPSLAKAKNTIVKNEENIIFIILGLILIAAGIFAFKTTQTVIQTASKISTKAAEVAA